MDASLEHLQLTEKLFRDVIGHLKERIQKLQAGHDEDDLDPDLVPEELATAGQSTVATLRLEICLYSLCVDWIRQQRDELVGVVDESRRHARDNFFRLMVTVAQSELARDAHARSFGFSSGNGKKPPLTDAQMFTALEGTAERQLANLIAV